MICGKLKIKICAYFVTSILSLVSNIVLTNLYPENENKQLDAIAFDLQDIKRVGQSFLSFDIFLFIYLGS